MNSYKINIKIKFILLICCCSTFAQFDVLSSLLNQGYGITFKGSAWPDKSTSFACGFKFLKTQIPINWSSETKSDTIRQIFNINDTSYNDSLISERIFGKNKITTILKLRKDGKSIDTIEVDTIISTVKRTSHFSLTVGYQAYYHLLWPTTPKLVSPKFDLTMPYISMIITTSPIKYIKVNLCGGLNLGFPSLKDIKGNYNRDIIDLNGNATQQPTDILIAGNVPFLFEPTLGFSYKIRSFSFFCAYNVSIILMRNLSYTPLDNKIKLNEIPPEKNKLVLQSMAIGVSFDFDKSKEK